jgi:hypothetical protein
MALTAKKGIDDAAPLGGLLAMLPLTLRLPAPAIEGTGSTGGAHGVEA